MEEARKAVVEQRFGDALDKYKQVYAATRSPLDACNVGIVAYHLSRLPEAFEHLSICTEHKVTPSELPPEKAVLDEVRRDLEDVRRRVGLLRIQMGDSRNGAVIAVDGKTIGTAPLARDVALDPWVTHRVKATLGAELAEEELSIPAGQTRTAYLVLSPSRAPKSPEQPLELKTAPAESTALAENAKSTDLAEPMSAPRLPFPFSLRESPLLWSGVVAGVIGGGVIIGAHVATEDAWEDQRRLRANAFARGCGELGPTFPATCDDQMKAAAALTDARFVREVATVLTVSSVGTAFIGAILYDLTSAPVQVAPSVGGIVISGAF